jgi:hypothetical protein
MKAKRVVFLGPSLPRERVPAERFACLELLPPVRQGDVLRAVAAGATHVGVVDGYFDHVPSVWHKELLYAMSQGVIVYGASSMGALRAAELHGFGMIGVGRVFELYRDGVLEDDDEVALLHEPEGSGYRPVSEAMVNLRDRLDAAVAASVLDRAEADRLALALKALPFPQRSVRRLVALAGSPSLEAFLKTAGPALKERDALALLERVARGTDRPLEVPIHVERTVFFERLRLEVERERWGALAPTPATSPEAARRRALLALLAVEHAALVGVSPSADDVQTAVSEFQIAHGLVTPEAIEAWLEARGVAVDRFFELAAEEATLRKLELLYQAEIEARAHDALEWSPPHKS